MTMSIAAKHAKGKSAQDKIFGANAAAVAAAARRVTSASAEPWFPSRAALDDASIRATKIAAMSADSAAS